MFKCTTKKYETLYARWLKNPGKLLDLAEFDSSRDTLLDLCGGTGAVAREALRRGAKKVCLLDLNPRCDDPRIVAIKGNAHDIGAYSHFPKIDLCVVRQSLGYLNLTRVISVLLRILSPGGRVALNGFIRPRWKLATYRHDQNPYLEASGHFLGRVAHVQAGLGGIDFSVFRHYKLATIRNEFDWYFDSFREEVTDRAFRLVFVRRQY